MKVTSTTTTWTCDSCGLQTEIGATSKLTVPPGWGCIAINPKSPDPAFDAGSTLKHQLCAGCLGVLHVPAVSICDLSALAQRAALATDAEFLNWRKQLKNACTEPDGSCSSCGAAVGAGHPVGCGVHR